MTTYHDAVEQFIAYEEGSLNRAPGTIRGHRTCLKLWAQVLIERGEDWRRATRTTAEKALAFARERSRSGRPGSYQRQVYSAGSLFYAYALSHEMAENDPWKGIPYPKYKAPDPELLTIEEIDALAGGCTSPQSYFCTLRDRAIVYSLYSSGARISELIGLDLPDYRRKHARARVLGKGAKERDVFFVADATDALHEYVELRAKAPTKDSALFLETTKWRRMSTQAVRAALTRAARRADIYERVYPHLLRHCFGTHMVEEGVDLERLRILLGHEDLKTTSRYVHLAAKHAAAAALDKHPLARRRKEST